MSYYIQLFDRAFGPLTKEKIHRLLQLKKINRSTIVSVDTENWQSLGSFPELIHYKETPVVSTPSVPLDTTPWNYSLDGVESVGPIPFTELYNLVQTGFLNSDAIVWKEGDSESFVLRDVKELAAALPSAGKRSKNLFKRLWGGIKRIFTFRSRSRS